MGRMEKNMETSIMGYIGTPQYESTGSGYSRSVVRATQLVSGLRV